LPINVKQSSSLTSFGRQIKLADLSKYLKGSATDINELYVLSISLVATECWWLVKLIKVNFEIYIADRKATTYI